MLFKRYINWLMKFYDDPFDLFLAAGQGAIFLLSMFGLGTKIYKAIKKKREQRPKIRLID